MGSQTKRLVVAAVALAAAAVSVYFAWSGRSQKVDLGTYEVLGAVTAEEMSRLVGRGEILVLVPDTGPDRNPSVEAELQAFQQASKKLKLGPLVARVPITQMLMLATGGGVPPDALFQAVDAHPKAAGLVLFFRFPQLPDSDISRLKNRSIKTIVVSSFYPDYKRLLENEVMQAAICPKSEPPPDPRPATRSVRERFNQDFVIFTRATLARVP